MCCHHFEKLLNRAFRRELLRASLVSYTSFSVFVFLRTINTFITLTKMGRRRIHLPFHGLDLIFQSWYLVGYINIASLNQREMLRIKQKEFFIVVVVETRFGKILLLKISSFFTVRPHSKQREAWRSCFRKQGLELGHQSWSFLLTFVISVISSVIWG